MGLGPRRRTRLELSTLEDRILCDAQLVTDTKPFPFRAVAKVISWWDLNHNHFEDNGEVFQATAAMIGPHSALTSAHVLYDPDLGGFATSITVMPGDNGGLPPFGALHAVNFVIPQSYLKSPFAGDDVGVINLARNIGRATGYFDVKAYSTTTLKRIQLNNIGYPGDTHTGDQQYVSAGSALIVTPSELRYGTSHIPVEHGSSGSPLYGYSAGSNRRVIVGVHSRRIDHLRIGLAARITPQIVTFVTRAEHSQGRGGIVDSPNGHLNRRQMSADMIAQAAWNAVHTELAHPLR